METIEILKDVIKTQDRHIDLIMFYFEKVLEDLNIKEGEKLEIMTKTLKLRSNQIDEIKKLFSSEKE
ncbi:hypothetical protein KXJ91_001402 [Campylobacter coli]|nr:hypothetical protein [Campylobacter coli]